MLVYDMIPERLGLSSDDPVWDEKRLAIEHASAYACISESTRRDLLEFDPAAHGKPATVVPLGVDDFAVRPEHDVEAFRVHHGLDRPYFLVVGERCGVGGYKNVGLVFRALHDWPEADAHELVCIGGRPEIESELQGSPRTYGFVALPWATTSCDSRMRARSRSLSLRATRASDYPLPRPWPAAVR